LVRAPGPIPPSSGSPPRSGFRGLADPPDPAWLRRRGKVSELASAWAARLPDFRFSRSGGPFPGALNVGEGVSASGGEFADRQTGAFPR